MFDDDDSDEAASTNPAPVRQAPAKKAPAAITKPSKGLFSDSDEEDALFSNKSTAVTPRVTGKQPSKGLFSDSDEDEVSAALIKQPPTLNKSASEQPAKGLFSDSDKEGDWSNSRAAEAHSTDVKTVTSAKQTVNPAPVKSAGQGLFGDSDDDDNMFTPSKKVESAVQPVAQSKPTSKGLFSESDEEGVVPAALPPAPTKTVTKPTVVKSVPGAFSDSDDDDLFSGKSGKNPLGVKVSSTESNAKSDSKTPQSVVGKYM